MGGTDYIFGGATAVFHNNTLMFAGNADNNNTGTITASSIENENQLGLLFWYNTVDYRLWGEKSPSPGQLGRPWRSRAQVTFYNTVIRRENNVAAISHAGWGSMGNTAPNQARFFEYGSVDQHGEPIITLMRPVNTTVPMGVLLDEWQILEFNPRNYLRGWDPMNFGATYLTRVDAALAGASIEEADGEITVITDSPDGVTLHWVVDENHVIVYARDNDNGYGDKRVINR
jgi:hypothetical protein